MLSQPEQILENNLVGQLENLVIKMRPLLLSFLLYFNSSEVRLHSFNKHP